MLKPDDPNFDWNSAEGKQATARLNHFLKFMDKGSVRTAVPLGKDENGKPFGVIIWRKP